MAIYSLPKSSTLNIHVYIHRLIIVARSPCKHVSHNYMVHSDILHSPKEMTSEVVITILNLCKRLPESLKDSFCPLYESQLYLSSEGAVHTAQQGSVPMETKH